jgi:hypothetical protein
VINEFLLTSKNRNYRDICLQSRVSHIANHVSDTVFWRQKSLQYRVEISRSEKTDRQLRTSVTGHSH